MSAKILLNVGREKSLKRQHPWIFSKAIKKIVGKPGLGETVSVYDAKENWLAYAAYSPESQIRMRVWSFDQSDSIDENFIQRRLTSAVIKRKALLDSEETTGIRLVAGESDLIPGLTVDKYNNILVCQILSAGVFFHKLAIINGLKALFPECSIYERSDVSVCQKEGLPENTGWLAKALDSTETVIKENGMSIKVNVETGHKTGFYLDQRESRQAAGRYAKNKTVLNCFSYTGAFSLFCAKGGAKQVTNVDVSDLAISIAKENIVLNGITETQVNFVQQDVFKLLRQYREQGSRFDMIILDPPKFAESKAQLNGACRGYKDINMLAMQLLNDGGTLLTFSCSGLMESGLFQKIVADAALDANKQVHIIERLHQAADHPVLTSFPEGYYLKGLVCKVYG